MSSRSQYTQIFSVAPSNRGLIGALIGKGGAKIRETTSTSGCQNIHYDRSQSQFVIEGSPSAVARAINVLGEQMAYQAARQEDRSYAEPTQKTFHVRFQNTKESAPAPSRRTNMYAALKGSDGRNIEQAWAPKHEPEKMGYDEWAAKAATERTALADMLAKTKSSGENATGIKRKRGVELAKVKGATHQKKPRLEDQTMWPELAKQTPRKTKTKTKNSGRKPVQIIISETGPSQFVRDSRSRHRDACAKASKVWAASQKTRSETPDKDPEEQAQRRAEQEEYMTKRDAYLKAHPDAVAPKRIQIESWADRIGLQSNLTEQDISNIDEFFAQQHTAGSVSMVPYMSESA